MTTTHSIMDNTTADKPPKPARRTKCEYITDKKARHVSYSKRKRGLLKKINELSVLTGVDILFIIDNQKKYTISMTDKMKESLQSESGQKMLAQLMSSK